MTEEQNPINIETLILEAFAEQNSDAESEQVVGDLRSVPVKESILRGFIYRLEGSDGYFYYGSTRKTLEDRFIWHQSVSQNARTRQEVTSHFEQLGWKNVTISAVHEMISNSEDLVREEGRWIKKFIDNPKCLNKRIAGRFETSHERFTRIYAERDGVKTLCSCGEYVVFAGMKMHLKGRRHKANMILKNLPETAAEKPADQYEKCPCGERVRHYNLPYHLTTKTHILKMKIKLIPEDELMSLPAPAPIPTPEGKSSHITYGFCLCGSLVDLNLYKGHLKLMKHAEGMLEKKLIIVPDIGEPTQDDKIPPGKQRCPCGKLVSFRSIREHQETLSHQTKMREIETEKIEEEIEKEQIDPEDEIPVLPKWRDKRKTLVECECKTMITQCALKLHLKSKIHEQRMDRLIKGEASPTKRVARLKEKITCDCGISLVRASLTAHRKSPGHLAYEAKKLAEVGAVGTQA